MLRIAIVEDHPEELQTLTAHLACFQKASHGHFCVTPFSSGEAFADRFSPGAFDVVFMDIFLSQLNGMDLARRIRQEEAALNQECLIVFTSSSEAFGAQSYRVQAMDYLVKPLTYAMVADVMQRIAAQLNVRRQAIRVSSGRSMTTLLLNDIIYVDFNNHYAQFHLADHMIKSHMSSKAVAEMFSPYPSFCNCYRNCLVNMTHVKRIDDRIFELTNGERMPISRSLYPAVREAYMNFLFSQAGRS